MTVTNLFETSSQPKVLPEGLGRLQGMQRARVQDGPPPLGALGPERGPAVPSSGGPPTPLLPHLPAEAKGHDRVGGVASR